ncbi:MAG: site-specific DNA-methyltransferase, partial [Dolichospermum sp.]
MKQKIKRGQVEEWNIERLIFYKHNAKLHPDFHVEQIANSIEEFTFLDPIAVDEKGEILEGHGRLLAAQKRGDETVPVIVVSGLTDAQKVAYRLAHNKLTMNTGFDFELLKIDFEFLQDEGFNLDLTGFNELELSFLDEEEEEETKGEGVGGEDDYEQPDEIESRVKLGEIWQLGRHKIACGDSTIESNVRALFGSERASICFTSPPYNLSGNNKLRNGRFKEEKTAYKDNYDDNLQGEEYLRLLDKFLSNAFIVSDYQFINIQCLSGNKISLFNWVGRYSRHLADVLIWSKTNPQPAMAEKVCNSAFEFIFVFASDNEPNRAIKTAVFSRGSFSNVYSSACATNREWTHGATFPVQVAEHYLSAYAPLKSLIYEPFLGSGTTIIAAEKMEGDRTVYGFELSPDYCEVIIQRWEKFTGKQAELIGRLDDSAQVS